MSENHTNGRDTKYIGVHISKDLYWQIREKLLEKRLSMSEAIVQGLTSFLDIPLKDNLLKDKK